MKEFLYLKDDKLKEFIEKLFMGYRESFADVTKTLNKYSIGIEIANKGHKFGYEKFSKMQILSLIKLSKYLINKYKINKKLKILIIYLVKNSAGTLTPIILKILYILK